MAMFNSFLYVYRRVATTDTTAMTMTFATCNREEGGLPDGAESLDPGDFGGSQ